MRALRSLLFLIGLAAALGGVLVGIRAWLDRAGIETVVTRHQVANYYLDKIRYLRTHAVPEVVYNVVFLGDSMVVSFPPEDTIPAMLQKEVARRGKGRTPVQIMNFGLAGTGVFDYYLLADVIAEAEPDMVIIGFNLASSSQRFRESFSRPELAGWLGADRLVESAMLPLNWIGLTFDRLLLYRALVELGLWDAWIRVTEEQTRVGDAREILKKQLAFRNRRGGSPENEHEARRAFWSLRVNNQKGNASRYTSEATRMHFGAILDGLRRDDPNIVMLEATVRTLHERGIETLVYLNPLNLDHIEALGLQNPEGLNRSIASARDAVERHGGLFLDFHDLFPDEGFRDQPGHFAYEGDFNGPKKIAKALAPSVMQSARREQR